MTAMTILWTASAVLLAVAVLLSWVRIAVGPSTLDRLVSLDTFSAVGQCAIGLYIAWTRDTTPAAAMVALALIAFIGSVSVARFRVPDDAGRARRLPGTREGRS